MPDKDNAPLSPEEEQALPQKGFKERMYDKVKLPLWAVDLIIALLVVALAVAIYLGTR